MAGATLLPAQPVLKTGALPLWFEQVSGVSASQFVAHGRDAEFSISSAGAGFILKNADGGTAAVKLKFVGADTAAKVSGESQLAGRINYFTGNDPSAWRSGVTTYGRVRLQNVYSGVDAVFYGNQQTLEYDFDVAPEMDSSVIGIRYEGARSLSLNSAGELVIGLAGGSMIQHHLVAYQVGVDGVRHDIPAAYKIVDATTVQFAMGDYDHSRALVIDPMLGYSTFFGGNLGEIGWAIALDGSNNIYVAGQTLSTSISNKTSVIPFSFNALYPTNHGGKYDGDAFVAKFDSTGQNLEYCTYLGGSADDVAYALTVDSAGHAYVAGGTDSTNFPTTNWVTTSTYSGKSISGVVDPIVHIFPGDAFVAELETDGSRLIYSTYLGGESEETAYGIALDPAGDAFVTGLTFSTNFPVINNPLQPTLQCSNTYDVNANAFVSEIASGGNTLNYSTYLGGTNYDVGRGIAYTNGFLYVCGLTESTNFPWTNGLTGHRLLNNFSNSPNRFDTASDGFVTAFTTSGTGLQLLYSTYLGSTNQDAATSVVGDGNGNAYVVGWTTSTNFPGTNTLLTSYIRTNTAAFSFATNAFLTQILLGNISTNAGFPTNGAVLGFSQVFGGFGQDIANGVALDGAGDVFVVGSASSTNFPTSGNLFGSLRSTNSSRRISGVFRPDVFVTAFQAGFSNLLYSTYLGGANDDFGYGIAVDASGNAFITGQTLSTNFPIVDPVTVNGLVRNKRVGTNDAFVAEILLQNANLPPLLANKVGTNVVVSWVTNGGPETVPALLHLETTTNLATFIPFVGTNIVITTSNSVTITNKVRFTNFIPTIFWTPVTNTPVTNNGTYDFIFNPTNNMRFYRFRPN